MITSPKCRLFRAVEGFGLQLTKKQCHLHDTAFLVAIGGGDWI